MAEPETLCVTFLFIVLTLSQPLPRQCSMPCAATLPVTCSTKRALAPLLPWLLPVNTHTRTWLCLQAADESLRLLQLHNTDMETLQNQLFDVMVRGGLEDVHLDRGAASAPCSGCHRCRRQCKVSPFQLCAASLKACVAPVPAVRAGCQAERGAAQAVISGRSCAGLCDSPFTHQ